MSVEPIEPPNEVVGVRFRDATKVVELRTAGLALCAGDEVVVETEHGPAMARVVYAPYPLERASNAEEARRRVVRLATDADHKLVARNRSRAREAAQFCAERARVLGLTLKVVQVEFAHLGTRAVFYFSADGRIDFRALVRQLAQRFHTRIEMRQIGVRDAAKLIGGIGVCGRELCCTTWLPAFAPVSIRMAKDQNLALNPQKVSGMCGRLMCCLAYEQDAYKDLRKSLPKLGKRVETPDGQGRVRDVDVLRQRVTVTFEDGTKTYEAREVRAVVAQVAEPEEPEGGDDLPPDDHGGA